MLNCHSLTSVHVPAVLPFQSEFLIPLRDRAFSWDVSFEDEIHAENEAAAISVISEQQDSHRLVIKAKASSGVKRQAEVKEAPPVEAAVEPAAKKGKNGSAAKKKESPAITSPTLQASKANLKTAATSSSANSSNGKPPIKGGAKNVPAATKAAVAAKKIFNVASSPSTEHLDTQTLRNTLNNAKSNADKTDFSSIKGEFGDLTGGMPFGFGSEFDVVSGGRHSVAFDDHLNMQFKQEDDFHDLSEEFGDEFRPPRKLSWSIDFNAIEAAMGGSLMNPMGEDAYNHGIAGGDPQMGYGASYSFESNLDHSANQAFPSLLRASETPGNNSTAAGSHIHPPGPMNINHQKPGLSMGSGVSGGHMGQGHYHPGSSSDHHSSGPASAASSSSSSMTAKMTDRDQLASMMGGNTHSTAHTHSQPHTNGQALAAAYAHSSGGGSNNASGLSSSSSSAMHNTGGGDSNHSSSSTVGGLTLGGLTVPNDGEFRVGAYTKLERHLKIEAFREKKRTRIWRKQIKYDCRKRLADTRPRYIIYVIFIIIDACISKSLQLMQNFPCFLTQSKRKICVPQGRQRWAF